MKKFLSLIFIFFISFICIGLFLEYADYKPKETMVTTTGVTPSPISYQDYLHQEKIKQQQIILAGLVSRCEKFGWKDDDDVASCVQQEAYRDLQIEKQKREIILLEQKIKLASAQTKNVDDEPLFFMFLDAYAQSKQQESMLQMKKDIARLKASSNYKDSSTKAALEALYRTNN
tara:strand:- start:576 stop:1097 length:522 start_codon:yes stop_codon:yes gene_type:complete